MIDLAIITAVLAHDRVGDQFLNDMIPSRRRAVRGDGVAASATPEPEPAGPETIEMPAMV
jgi:hypothetical protein